MKDQPQPQPEADDRASEKDPRFIEFIKRRAKEADDPANRLDGHKVMNDLRKKYGLPCH
jgi:hypothetical protein